MKNVRVYKVIKAVGEPLEDIKVEVSKDGKSKIHSIIYTGVPFNCKSCGAAITLSVWALVDDIVELIEEEK